MKKLISAVLILVLCFCATSALAAGKLNVAQENFHFIPGIWNYGYAYAKVENTGDKPINVNAGVLEIYDEAGDVITSADYLQTHAECLQPGEYTYVEMYGEIEDEAVVPADYMLTLTGKSKSDTISLRLPCESDLKLGVKDGWWTYNYMYATATNNTEEVLFDISVVFALLDAEGNILYMDEDNLYSDRGLMPGSSIVFRKDIPSSFMEYFETNELIPVSVDAIVYVEVESIE